MIFEEWEKTIFQIISKYMMKFISDIQNLSFKILHFEKKNHSILVEESVGDTCIHDRSCAHSRLAVSFTIYTLQNILKMHFTVKYLKFWRKKILIGFCILCTFFQINISVPKLSLKHLPLKYDFITINIFIWVANKTLIQKK